MKDTPPEAARPELLRLVAPDRPAPQEPASEPARPGLLVLETPPRTDRLPRDREFLPAALAIMDAPPSPARVVLTLVLCGLLTAALGWSYFGRLDVYAVAAGKLQASGRTKVVQPVVAGQVIAIHAKDGDHVRKDDVLVQLDPTEALAAQAATADSLNSQRAEIARGNVEMAAARSDPVELRPTIPWAAEIPHYMREREERVLISELSQLSATLLDLAAQRKAKEAARDKYVAGIAAENALLAALSETAGMTEQLMKDAWSSRAKYLEKLQTVLQAKEVLATLQGNLDAAKSAIAVIDAEIVQTRETFQATNMDKLAAADRQADKLAQELIEATEKVKDLTLRAPISGTVQASAVTTLGQVVTTGQQLMDVVPEGRPLEIEAYVLNQDIGFVAKGQAATIKVDTFPYSRYGTISGTVTKLANDAIPGKQAQGQQNDPSQPPSLDGALSITSVAQNNQDLVFPVIVTPAQSAMDINGRQIPLLSGMTVTVEIRTESRRAIDYILSPLIDTFSTAAHER